MKISSVKVDSVKIEQGAWIGEKYGTPIPEMGDLCLNVRGANNVAWRKLQATLIGAVPRNKRIGGRIDPLEQDKITSILLRDTGLCGWDNMIDENDAAVPYTKEAAAVYFNDPDFRAFRDAVLWACTIVGDEVAEEVETSAKNSSTS